MLDYMDYVNVSWLMTFDAVAENNLSIIIFAARVDDGFKFSPPHEANDQKRNRINFNHPIKFERKSALSTNLKVMVVF